MVVGKLVAYGIGELVCNRREKWSRSYDNSVKGSHNGDFYELKFGMTKGKLHIYPWFRWKFHGITDRGVRTTLGKF